MTVEHVLGNRRLLLRSRFSRAAAGVQRGFQSEAWRHARLPLSCPEWLLTIHMRAEGGEFIFARGGLLLFQIFN